MEVQLTEEQAKQLAANAINASKPMGMGWLHYTPTSYTLEDAARCISDRGINIDYFEGRMVKLYVRRNGDMYSFNDGEPRGDYQSWCVEYPTYQALIDSVLEVT